MMVLRFFLRMGIHLLFLCFGCHAAFAADHDDHVRIGMLTNDAPASDLMQSGYASGIGIDIVSQALDQQPISYELVPFSDRVSAVAAFINDDVQLLVGSFSKEITKNNHHLMATSPYLLDEVKIVSTTKPTSWIVRMVTFFMPLSVSFVSALSALGIILTYSLYLSERYIHPRLKHAAPHPQTGVISLRIIHYFFWQNHRFRPYSRSGQWIAKVWMITLILVAFIFCCMVSVSLYHFHHSRDDLGDLSELQGQSVGILYGRDQKYLQKLKAQPVVYQEAEALFHALAAHDVSYALVGRSALERYVLQHPASSSHIRVSQRHFGYDAWVVLGHKNYGQARLGQPLIEVLDAFINHVQSSNLAHDICARHTKIPSLCIF